MIGEVNKLEKIIRFKDDLAGFQMKVRHACVVNLVMTILTM